MKKARLMMLGLMAMAASAVQAHQSGTCSASAQKVEAQCEEQAFVAKLSEAQKNAFGLMTADQRKAVLAAAADATISADAAVEKVINEHKIAQVNVEVKTSEKQ